MCIDNLKPFVNGEKVPKYGYKVMDVEGKYIDGKYQIPANPKEIIFHSQHYNHERKYMIGEEYTSTAGMGFNCFYTVASARQWGINKWVRLVKVKVSGVTQKGEQGMYVSDGKLTHVKAFCCDKMTIVEVIE